MELKEKIIDNKNRIHDFLTQPKLVKYCLILFFIIFIPSLIVGYIVAFSYRNIHHEVI